MNKKDISSSLYIHIPFCNQKCDYCDFYSIQRSAVKKGINSLSDRYIEALCAEIAFYAEKYGIKEWKSVYIGGGTPSLMTISQLKMLSDGIKAAAPFSSSYEATMEMNPESVTKEIILHAWECGINRISMGVQALDDKVLSYVNRGCTVKEVYNALDLLKRYWKGDLSCDFIAGLPLHTYKSFEKQFEIISEYEINHVSLYTLTVEENTPLGIKYRDGKINLSFEKADNMWIKGRNILNKLGFNQYEVSNFSRPGFESIHNSVYWKLESYIGCGAGATGSWYEDNIRWTNTLSIPSYTDYWLSGKDGSIPRSTETIDTDIQEFEFLMMGLRRLEGVSASVYKDRFGKNLEDTLGVNNGLYKEWSSKGLTKTTVSKNDIRYALNRRGILLLNRFLEELI